MNVVDWNWWYSNIEDKNNKINIMNSIYEATKAQPNGEDILTANLYMKTNITFYLSNSSHNNIHQINKTIYITPEGNEIIPPPIPDSFANGEYTWNFSAMPVDMKCDFNGGNSLDETEVSGVSNQFLATVTKTANIELVKENDEEKFRDDKTKKRDIVSRNVTTDKLIVNNKVIEIDENDKIDFKRDNQDKNITSSEVAFVAHKVAILKDENKAKEVVENIVAYSAFKCSSTFAPTASATRFKKESVRVLYLPLSSLAIAD